MSETGAPLQDPIFSPDVHEIGTRLVDMLNQVSFLYRFPSLAGVTLACIGQHIGPLQRLLGLCQLQREALSRDKWPDGFRAGPILHDEILEASFEHALSGYQSFVGALVEAASDGGATRDEVATLTRLRNDRGATPSQVILEMRLLIERYGEAAIDRAGRAFVPLQDLDWQKLRVDVFCFLFELDAVYRRDSENSRADSSP